MINEIGTLILIYSRTRVGFLRFSSPFLYVLLCHHQCIETTLLLLSSSFPWAAAISCIKNYQWTKKGLEGDETKWKLIATFECFFLKEMITFAMFLFHDILKTRIIKIKLQFFSPKWRPIAIYRIVRFCCHLLKLLNLIPMLDDAHLALREIRALQINHELSITYDFSSRFIGPELVGRPTINFLH